MKDSINILLIEDNPGDILIIQELLSENLQRRFNITVSERLSSGLESLASQVFDVILLDLTLPDCQGLESLSEVLAKAPHVAVVVLTGLDDENMALDSLRAGAQDYLVKVRLDPDSLLRSVRYAIERKRVEEALLESRQVNRVLLDAPLDAVVILNSDGVVVDMNARLSRILGRPDREIVGIRIWELLPREISAIHRKHFQEVMTTGDPQRFTDEVNGIWYDYVVYPVLDAMGGISKVAFIARDITAMKKKEQALVDHERELETKTADLEEANAALKALLKRRETDNIELEEKLMHNIEELVGPFIKKLKNSNLTGQQMGYLDIIESNLEDIVSPFVRSLSSKYLMLTPTEIQVANFVKQGKTSKEAADYLNLSIRTVEVNRNNIRKKLGLTNKKVNLRTYLLTLH